MSGGERAGDHLASLLHTDYIRTLRLLGSTQTEDLTPDLVEIRTAAQFESAGRP